MLLVETAHFQYSETEIDAIDLCYQAGKQLKASGGKFSKTTVTVGGVKFFTGGTSLHANAYRKGYAGK